MNDRVKEEIFRIVNIITLNIENNLNIFKKEEVLFNLEVIPSGKHYNLRGLAFSYNEVLKSPTFQLKENKHKYEALIHYRNLFEEILNL